MFTKDNAVVQILRARREHVEKPAVGTILRGIRDMPVRIHCQASRSKETEIFAYATMVFLRKELTVDGQQWFLRDYASPDLVGTKVILNSRSREELFRRYERHPVFSEVDVLPVASVRILREAASGKSFEAEIHAYLDSEKEELCAEYARIAMEGNDADTAAARQDFYAVEEEVPAVQ